jgi:uncharacterized membrane protein
MRINVFIEGVRWFDPHEINLHVPLLPIREKQITAKEKKDKGD